MRKKSDYNEIYKEVISLVEDGMSIDKAIKKTKTIDKSGFYRNISPEQKRCLNNIKISNSLIGQGNNYKYNYADFKKMHDDIFSLNEEEFI